MDDFDTYSDASAFNSTEECASSTDVKNGFMIIMVPIAVRTTFYTVLWKKNNGFIFYDL